MLSVPNGENVLGENARGTLNAAKYDSTKRLYKFESHGHVIIPQDGSYRLEVSREDLIAGGKFLLDLPGKKLEVSVPPGTEDGARIRITKEGEDGMYGGPPGDLILRVALDKE